MKINIYSPFDGYVKKIEDISDPAFASKALGDGVFIIPENEIMTSPIDNAKIEVIADTKHAYYFSNDYFNVLVHVGLDTVNLDGKPFQLLKTLGDNVSKTSEIMKLNKNYLPNNVSVETPILVETTNFKKYKLNFKKINQKVKQGDLIFEIEFERNEITVDELVKMDREINKYTDIAQKILQAIGGKENQTDVYNCMTRLRFKIKDKDLVNENKIKNISIVKGINWAGQELQIIIGGEVYKVKQECSNIIENKVETVEEVKKIPFKKKLAPAITSILFPTIPLLIGTGIIGGLQAILVVSGVLKNPSSPADVMNLDIASALFYVASKVGIELIGVAFLYSTVKYLRGETPMALLLALLLTSRYLFGSGWVLFTFIGNDISIKSYESTVLPMIAAGFLVHYLNVWTKKWMPSTIDVVFRTAFVVFVSFIVIMFTVGPFFRIIEQVISQFVILLGKIPYGLGLGIFAMLWQALVLTGTHVAVVTAISLPMTQTPAEPSVMYAALQIAIVGQIGATIAVAIRTKNNKIKQACFGGLPGSIFGITEPIIYGVNLRKFWPFIYGSLGALVGGTIGGILGLHQESRTGTGVMSYIGLGIGTNLIMGLIASLIALGCAFALTFVFYIDRKSELKEFEKSNKLLYKVLIKSNNIEKNDQKLVNLKTELGKIKEKIKEENNYKIYEKDLISLSNKEIKLQKMNETFSKHKDKMYNKAIKIIEKDKEKYNLLATNYNNFIRDEKFDKIQFEISNLSNDVDEINSKYQKFNSEIVKEVELLIKNSQLKIDEILLKNIIFNYSNAVNNLEISYELEKEKEIDYLAFKEFFKENRRVNQNV